MTDTPRSHPHPGRPAARRVLREMVIAPTIMTMSARRGHWSVAEAKARLSELMDQARTRPQTIERRGRPLVVVLSIAQYENSDDAARWHRFVQTSAEIRAAGGASLRVPRRTRRRSPFARS
jgi:prevent-host-death family protein